MPLGNPDHVLYAVTLISLGKLVSEGCAEQGVQLPGIQIE
jgi:hypothetical protein